MPLELIALPGYRTQSLWIDSLFRSGSLQLKNKRLLATLEIVVAQTRVEYDHIGGLSLFRAPLDLRVAPWAVTLGARTFPRG